MAVAKHVSCKCNSQSKNEKNEKNEKHNLYICRERQKMKENLAGYTATQAVYGWTWAVLEKVTRASVRRQYALKAQKRQKNFKKTKKNKFVKL